MKIRIRTRNNNNDITTAEPELLLQQQQQKLLELIRSKAIQDIAAGDDGKSGTPEEQMKAVNAGYRFLWTYGFEGNEMKKAWRELSEWRHHW